ncbi:centrosomal protein 43 isoform X11 [Carassius gibelio]|uniref:centrosomal protein 43 isoform X11 n=1 Tax=Carassius gibelio TaxID=101364 RepID=UPI00227937CB|nr:centrosomal protein 43 isoform X11 [Carassius gibelio]
MSATEEDTELRDLLIQNLENSGVLNKIKAELRAAVFLALEEQDKVANKTPLVNENLKKSLNTKDELGISETAVNKNTPLLLELVKRGRHKEGDRLIERTFPKELLPRQIADARKRFDSHDKNRSGEINREAVIGIFTDLFPQFSRNMLDSYVTEEFRAKGKNTTVDFQDFLGMYKCFFIQCRSVVSSESSDALYTSSNTSEDKIISSSTSKAGDRRPGEPLGSQKNRGSVQVSEGTDEGLGDGKNLPTSLRRALEFGLEDEDEGDSFFDDPLPQPQKTYGWGEGLGSSLGKAFMADAQLKSAGGSFESSQKDHSSDKNGTSSSKDKVVKEFPVPNEKTASPLLDDDLDYDDDFNSHLSENSKSEVSIDEEIEVVSIEGPDISHKLDETTQDVSVSQISLGADYIEDVA